MNKKTSFVHNMHPTIKIILAIILLILTFIPSGLLGKSVVILIVITLFILSKVGKKVFFKTLFLAFVMLILLVLINWLVMKSPGLITNHHHVFGKINGLWKTIHDGFATYEYFYFPLIGGHVDQVNIIHSSINPLQNSENIYIMLSNGVYMHLQYTFHWYTLSVSSLVYALNTTFMIFLSLLIVTLTIATTNNVQLTYGIEKFLKPLRIFRLPTQEWAMIIAVALRFVPTLLTQSWQILNTQASRGVDFKNGNIKNKLQALVSLVLPLFVLAFHSSDDLANAMEARGYSPETKRTQYRSYRLKVIDYFILIFSLLLFGFFIFYCAKHYYFGPYGPVDCWLLFGSN